MSVKTHYSIGGFDVEKIQGGITCDIGTSDPYEAIGRGNLNIEFMPGLRDDIGYFGTPTSDSTRTMVNDVTKTLLLVFYDFMGDESLQRAMNTGIELLQNYCEGNIVFQNIVTKS